jgi:hypothetical protein
MRTDSKEKNLVKERSPRYEPNLQGLVRFPRAPCSCAVVAPRAPLQTFPPSLEASKSILVSLPACIASIDSMPRLYYGVGESAR